MKTLAAVLVETGHPPELLELDLPAPAAGQVLVGMAFSAVCHTQLLEVNGLRGEDRYLPHGLGHEGSGVVLEVGAGVRKVRTGQRVLLSWMKGAGAEVSSSIYRSGGRRINAGAVTTFAHHVLASENRLTPLPDFLPPRQAAFFGCAVPTGAGAVLNTGGARAGQSVAVLGVGGVGQCALAAAAITGCAPVVAVDLSEERLAIARRMGATHTLHAQAQGGVDVAAALRAIAPALDLAVEATGRPEAMAQALAWVRPRGGRAVLVGNAAEGSRLTLDPKAFNQGKSLLGSWGGDNDPQRDFPRYFDWYRAGRLDLGPFDAPPYALSELSRALADLAERRVLRPLLALEGAGS